MPDPEPMVEKKSKFLLLLIEDNPQFAANALDGLKGHDVTWVTTLEGAFFYLAKRRPDFIISDVHFPAKIGEEPKENITQLMHAALEEFVPVVFVTQADHHGLTERDEGFVSIKALTISNLVQTLMVLTHEGADKGRKAFSIVKSEKTETIKTSTKTPDIWAKALDAIRNANEQKHGPITLAIKKTRETVGAIVVVENGLPVVKPPRRP